jgi:uncharacterized membrane protein
MLTLLLTSLLAEGTGLSEGEWEITETECTELDAKSLKEENLDLLVVENCETREKRSSSNKIIHSYDCPNSSFKEEGTLELEIHNPNSFTHTKTSTFTEKGIRKTNTIVTKGKRVTTGCR